MEEVQLIKGAGVTLIFGFIQIDHWTVEKWKRTACKEAMQEYKWSKLDEMKDDEDWLVHQTSADRMKSNNDQFLWGRGLLFICTRELYVAAILSANFSLTLNSSSLIWSS